MKCDGDLWALRSVFAYGGKMKEWQKPVVLSDCISEGGISWFNRCISVYTYLMD